MLTKRRRLMHGARAGKRERASESERGRVCPQVVAALDDLDEEEEADGGEEDGVGGGDCEAGKKRCQLD